MLGTRLLSNMQRTVPHIHSYSIHRPCAIQNPLCLQMMTCSLSLLQLNQVLDERKNDSRTVSWLPLPLSLSLSLNFRQTNHGGGCVSPPPLHTCPFVLLQRIAQSLLFDKVLTKTDTSGLGRIILPKVRCCPKIRFHPGLWSVGSDTDTSHRVTQEVPVHAIEVLSVRSTNLLGRFLAISVNNQS